MKKNNPLARSTYKSERGRQMKSCPCCSQREGRLVFKPLEEFGERAIGESILPQPWCAECRTASTRARRARKGA
jgi:hypothetical protein